MTRRRPATLLTLALILGASLGACTDEKNDLAAKVGGQVARIQQLDADLQAVEQSAVGYLLGDAKAADACLLTEESQYFEAAFAELYGPINKTLAEAKSLVETGSPSAPYKTPEDQILGQDKFIQHIEGQLSGARRSAELLHEAVENRRGLKERADRAWFGLLADAKAAAPWFNRARTQETDNARKAATEADYQVMLGKIDSAKTTYREIVAGFQQVESGKRFSCSSWSILVVKIEALAADIAKLSHAADQSWNPGVDQRANDKEKPSGK